MKFKRLTFESPIDLPLGVTLFNLGNIGETEVDLEYFIKDSSGEVILHETGIVSVDKQVSFTKTLKIPAYLRPDSYSVIVYAKYGSSVGTATDQFEAVDKEAVMMPSIIEFKGITYIITAASLVFIIIISLILFQNYKIRNIEKLHPRIVKKYRQEASKIKPMSKEAVKMKLKLEKHLEMLKKSHDSGYINDVSYNKAKDKVDKMINDLN